MVYFRYISLIATIFLYSCGESQERATDNNISAERAEDVQDNDVNIGMPHASEDGTLVVDDISQNWNLQLKVPQGVETAITSEGVNLTYSAAGTEQEITDGYYVDIEVEDGEDLAEYLEEEGDLMKGLKDITLGKEKGKTFNAMADIGPGSVQHYVYQLGSGDSTTLVDISLTTFGDKEEEYKQQVLGIIEQMNWSLKN